MIDLPNFVDGYDVYTSGLAEHEWLWQPRVRRVPSFLGERTFTDPTDGATRPIWGEDVQFDVVCCRLCRNSLRRLPMVLYTSFFDSSAEEIYPDLQFERFGNLCLQCRNPLADEGGHFVEGGQRLMDTDGLGYYMETGMCNSMTALRGKHFALNALNPRISSSVSAVSVFVVA